MPGLGYPARYRGGGVAGTAGDDGRHRFWLSLASSWGTDNGIIVSCVGGFGGVYCCGVRQIHEWLGELDDGDGGRRGKRISI